MSTSLRPHGRQLTRLLCPRDSPLEQTDFHVKLKSPDIQSITLFRKWPQVRQLVSEVALDFEGTKNGVCVLIAFPIFRHQIFPQKRKISCRVYLYNNGKGSCNVESVYHIFLEMICYMRLKYFLAWIPDVYIKNSIKIFFN